MSTRGAAAPGTGHMVSTPDRVELCVLPEESTARCKCPVFPPPPDMQGRIEKQIAMLPRGLYTEQNYCAKAVLGFKVNVSKLVELL